MRSFSAFFGKRLVMLMICSLVLFAYNISYSSKKKKKKLWGANCKRGDGGGKSSYTWQGRVNENNTC